MSQPAEGHAALSRRVEELEVKVAFHEHLLAELDEVIRTMRGELDTLRQDHDETRAQVQALAPDPANEKPPHY